MVSVVQNIVEVKGGEPAIAIFPQPSDYKCSIFQIFMKIDEGIAVVGYNILSEKIPQFKTKLNETL